jgi:hypothetical protein
VDVHNIIHHGLPTHRIQDRCFICLISKETERERECSRVDLPLKKTIVNKYIDTNIYIYIYYIYIYKYYEQCIKNAPSTNNNNTNIRGNSLERTTILVGRT